MISIKNDKVSGLPLSKPILSALFEAGESDIAEYAGMMNISPESMKQILEKRLLVDNVTVEMGVCAINFIPDVINERRSKGFKNDLDSVLFQAVDMAIIYATNCKGHTDGS